MTASVALSDLSEETGDQLLQKVSIPKMRGPVAPVPELYDRLSEGVVGPLTVVRGPAGAGKTTLVAAWIANDLPPGPVAWLSLDEHDNDPVQFWTVVVQALRIHGVHLPATVRCPSESASLFLAFLDELAVGLERGGAPVVLVLDRFDPLTNARVLRQLGLLLLKSPELHLVVTTRRPPPGALGRRRLTVVL